MAVTIYDIADKLNISVATVNRAFSINGRISPATKELVLKTAEEMGYKANKAAQSLRRNPIKIGVLLCCPSESYLDEIFRGVNSGFEAIEQYNVFPETRLMVGNAAEHKEDVLETLNEFEAAGCGGIILFLSGNCDMFKDKLEDLASRVPLGYVANDLGFARALSVTADGLCAGGLAAELLGLCKQKPKIAIVTGSRHTDIHAAYIEGFIDYAENHNFSAPDILEHNDNQEKFESIMNNIAKNGGYDGVYITSSVTLPTGNMAKLLRDKGINIVATDLSSVNRNLLKNQQITAVIFQDPFLQGKTVVKRLYDYIINRTAVSESILPNLIFSTDADRYQRK